VQSIEHVSALTGSSEGSRLSLRERAISNQSANSIPKLRNLISIRRILAIALMSAFIAPSAALLHAGRDTSVPACCRRDGKHHCMMAKRALALVDDGPSFRPAEPVCPYRCHSSLPVGARGAPPSPNNSVALLPTGIVESGPAIIGILVTRNLQPSRGPPPSLLI
jgi:hypothetical protein